MPAFSLFAPANSPFLPSFSTYMSPNVGSPQYYSSPLPPQSPPQPESPRDDQLIDTSVPDEGETTKRKDSVITSSPNGPTRSYSEGLPSPHPDPSHSSVRTDQRSHSAVIAPGIALERKRSLGSPRSEDDVIIVTVRLSNKFRRSSISGAEDLPTRPPPRGFFRRMSTRLNMDHTAEREERYKAVKMPRRDYKRYFARDRDGNYAGTEPEREWDEDDLANAFGQYQHMPIHNVLF